MTPEEILAEMAIRDRPLENPVQKDDLRALVEHVRWEERERAAEIVTRGADGEIGEHQRHIAAAVRGRTPT